MHYNAIMTTTPTKDAAVPASVQHRTSSIGLVSAIAALGGILFGYDTGVMSGALLFIKPDFDMSATQEGVITSILMIGAALGALSGGRLADAIGRRWAVFWAGILFIVASLACAFSGVLRRQLPQCASPFLVSSLVWRLVGHPLLSPCIFLRLLRRVCVAG